MLPGGFQQTLFTKFLALTVQSFRNTIGVKQDGVAWSQLAFFRGVRPHRPNSRVADRQKPQTRA